ncbi:MAG: hypothetical protein U9Q82_05265, partial [Chloroflexota bacterium]|nr:hypothetical protein [Chloroflexota bacterium]
MKRSHSKRKLAHNWSIRKKLTVVFLLAALLPLIIISDYQLIVGTSILNGMAEEELELLSMGVAGRFDQLLSDNKVTALQLSSDPTVYRILEGPADAQAQKEVDDRFLKILESNSFYEYVYLLDTDGLVLVSIQREGLPSIEGNFYWDRNYFLQAREGNTYIDALVGRSSKQLGFYFTA